MSSLRRLRWEPIALLWVLALAAFLYLWNLTVSGYANTYYSMAAQAAGQDWSAWLWGSLDPSNFITVDKPPLATMLLGLSVRVFGLSSWAILLPQALCGVATVAVLYAIVRRTSGFAAATIAAVVAALTPAAVLIFRYNNPDALLTLLLVLAAWAFIRSLSTGSLRWVAVAALFVGLAFNTKFLQAYLVLPAFAVTYAIAAPGSARRRLAGLATAAVVTVASSAWWVAAVELVPAASRPFIGGSTDGSALQLLFGYDGLGRIFGFGGGGGPASAPGGPGGGLNASPGGGLNAGPGGGFGFGGSPGLLRMLNTRFGGQIAWFLPFAATCALSSLAIARGRPRTHLPRAAVLMWSLWLAAHLLVFSLMGGIIHTYYMVVVAPAIGALVGTGVVDLHRARASHRTLAGLVLAVAIASSTLICWDLLVRTPDFLPWLAPLVAVAGFGAAVVVGLTAFVPARFMTQRRLGTIATAAAAVGLVAILAGPVAYASSTVSTAFEGGDPAAGPVATRTSPLGKVFGTGSDDDLFAGPPVGFRPPTLGGAPPSGFGREGDLSEQELAYLVANRGSARLIVAANSSNQAAPIQLATGQPVMAMGGFSGGDPAPTQDQLKAYVTSKQVRFVLVEIGGFGGLGPGGAESENVGAWVRANCSVVVLPDDVESDHLYDCAGAS